MDAENANKTFKQNPDKKPVLVDLESVLLDYDATIQRELERLYPDSIRVEIKNHGCGPCIQYKNPEMALLVKKRVAKKENFWKSIQPQEENINNMLELARLEDVWICSSLEDPHTVTEKKEWLGKHVGPEWGSRLILTTDKTLLEGAYLFDGRPDVTGKNKNPSWQHWLILCSSNDPVQPITPNTGVISARPEDLWTYFFICSEVPRSLDYLIRPMEKLVRPLVTHLEVKAYWEMARRFGSADATTLLLPHGTPDSIIQFLRKELKESGGIVINAGVPEQEYRDIVLANVGEEKDQKLVFTIPIKKLTRNDGNGAVPVLKYHFHCHGEAVPNWGIPYGAKVFRGFFYQGMMAYAEHAGAGDLSPFIQHNY